MLTRMPCSSVANWAHVWMVPESARADDRNRMCAQPDRPAGLKQQVERVHLASSRVNLQLAQERFPNIVFSETREVH